MNPINKLFNNMDTWRHLPAYQLERRADIFFSIYLPEVLSDKFQTEIEGIIPEFPVHIGSITTIHTNKSFKIDYLAKAKKILFVELKTDEGSRRGAQDLYLEQAKLVGVAKLLDGLSKICQATTSKRKYNHLLGHLDELGLIHLESSGNFGILPGEYEIEIVYIQPNNPYGQKNVITFKDFAEIVERHDDEVSRRFAESLRRWADTKAGDGEKTGDWRLGTGDAKVKRKGAKDVGQVKVDSRKLKGGK